MLRVVFICSGNICRSPMAVGVFSHEAQLRGIDQLTISMGTLGIMNAPAADEAIAACERIGIDLRSHRSQPVSAQLLQRATHIFIMEVQHERALAAQGITGPHVQYLGAWDPEDPTPQIDDPVDQSQEVFDACLLRIVRATQHFLDNADE